MSRFGGLFYRGFILFWVGYLSLAQPGIPPCWLEEHTCEIHPHFSRQQAEMPHTHEYLFDLAKSSTAVFLPVLVTPVSLLIELFSLSLLIYGALHHIVSARHWTASIEPPPPRSLSFC